MANGYGSVASSAERRVVDTRLSVNFNEKDGLLGNTTFDIEHSKNLDARRSNDESSLPEYNSEIDVPAAGTQPWYRAIRSYIGPGALVAVGYMDPGNWSTDIAGGSAFGYHLLFIVLLSSLMAIFLQILALRAGLATGRDLAQICRDTYPKPVVALLWIVTELAICATDIAEVLGSAIALKLMFGMSLVTGVCLTVCDIFIFLALNGKRFRLVEVMVAFLIAIITISFTIQLVLSKPDFIPLMEGFLPSQDLITNKQMLFVGVGIIGATVMPHNLFLHSSIVLTRNINRNNPEQLEEAIKYFSIDSSVSLFLAFFVNAAILMVSAAGFHKQGYTEVASLEDAYKLLNPVLHSRIASFLFGLALLASGQNSTLTGTLTGQIVMEGFMTWKISPNIRRTGTRLLAILPAVIATIIGGDESANYLLLLSQVVLSFALPFAVIPLVHITSSKAHMGEYANNSTTCIIAWIITIIILGMNLFLVM